MIMYKHLRCPKRWAFRDLADFAKLLFREVVPNSTLARSIWRWVSVPLATLYHHSSQCLPVLWVEKWCSHVFIYIPLITNEIEHIYKFWIHSIFCELPVYIIYPMSLFFSSIYYSSFITGKKEPLFFLT